MATRSGDDDDDEDAVLRAKHHIEHIRRNKYFIGENQPNPLTLDLHHAVTSLSAELYTKDVHFLMELIQNAEDNEYMSGVEPTLEFVVTTKDITGCGAPATLLVFNNEVGFSSNNMDSICSVGRSTKKGLRNQGFIGEKGIGFKSVFIVSAQPHIFSNGYQVRFNELPNEDCGVGYIIPEWVDNNPTVADIQQIYGSDKILPTTTFILPLKPEKVEAVKKQLLEMHPEVLLFLCKIKRLSIRESNGDSRTMDSVSSVAIATKEAGTGVEVDKVVPTKEVGGGVEVDEVVPTKEVGGGVEVDEVVPMPSKQAHGGETVTRVEDVVAIDGAEGGESRKQVEESQRVVGKEVEGGNARKIVEEEEEDLRRTKLPLEQRKEQGKSTKKRQKIHSSKGRLDGVKVRDKQGEETRMRVEEDGDRQEANQHNEVVSGEAQQEKQREKSKKKSQRSKVGDGNQAPDDQTEGAEKVGEHTKRKRIADGRQEERSPKRSKGVESNKNKSDGPEPRARIADGRQEERSPKRSRGVESSKNNSNRPEPPIIKFDRNQKALGNAKIYSKKVLFGKVVKYAWFSSKGFKFKSLFNRLGWKHFVGIKDRQYTQLVREFYASLTMRGKCRGLSTTVMGTKISFDADDLARIYKIKRGEFDACESNKWVEFDGFNKDDALKEICMKNEDGKGGLKSSQLTLEARLLHFIVVNTLTPRTGSKDHVTKFDVFVMWCILHNKKLDLPNVIMRYMWISATVEKTGLAYGMYLTPLFREYDLLKKADRLDVVEPNDGHTYNDTTLSQMRYVQTNDGKYVKKTTIGRGESPQRGSQSNIADNADSDIGANLQLLGYQMQCLCTQLNEHNVVVTERLDALEERVRVGLDDLKTLVTNDVLGDN